MSVVGVYPLKLERGADLQVPAWTFYSVWTGNPTTSTLFSFVGMSADCGFRVTPNDTGALVLALTPTLGGAAGTYTLPLITAANIETLLAAAPSGKLWWGCRYINSGSPQWFVEHSPVTVSPQVLHP